MNISARLYLAGQVIGSLLNAEEKSIPAHKKDRSVCFKKAFAIADEMIEYDASNPRLLDHYEQNDVEQV